eukprot:CAMPEP_0118874362 /NCGR_PEP_ID=MMETSP1163-20130328/15840_1 /TAXON_ID=124430 /ORGANISM="Phaeomonas parva, Strain CCMP2877" /LENGTH=78 /DNA_ID=CAMNT_0006809749 /DNA_START=1 /DNA_END=234 /DNA_ORIENTATION=-
MQALRAELDRVAPGAGGEAAGAVFVIGVTSLAARDLDASLLTGTRFGSKLYCGLPDLAARAEILGTLARRVPFEGEGE